MSDHDSQNTREDLQNDLLNLQSGTWPLKALSTQDNDAGFIHSKQTLLSWAAQYLTLSPNASAMIAEAAKEGWSLGLEPLNGPDFHINVPEKEIILDDQGFEVSALGRSEYCKNTLLISLTRALRDVWQEKRHGAFDDHYGPENVLMLERVRAADLDVIAVFVAWELRGEGDGSLWRHFIGSEDGDLAMRFSGYLEQDPLSLFNGKALAAVFKQWFKDKTRVNACDHEILNYLDSVCAEHEAELCASKKVLTPVGLEVLSCLPNRTAYLQGQGTDILSDPLFAGLDDEFNQAHFMQIIRDMKVVRVHDIPFRDGKLASKIFPNGLWTAEDAGSIH